MMQVPQAPISEACRKALMTHVETIPFDERQELLEATRRAAKHAIRRDWRMWCWGIVPCVPMVVYSLMFLRARAAIFPLPMLPAVAFYVLGEIAVGRMRRNKVCELLAVKFPSICRSCGYNLTGNASGVCPERGTAIVGGKTT
jgi:hypothetical protein